MTLFIYCDKKTENDVANNISELEDLKTQILRAWHKSNIKHCFKDKNTLNRAVHKNWETLKSLDEIDRFFKSCNYLFSTQAKGREETLYFKDRATKQTGRLRQQHPKGPLAKIDKKSRKHRFLSVRRFKFVKKWRAEHKNQLPRFYVCEKRIKNGKHHVEFSCDGKEWHASKGTVRKRKPSDHHISSALKNILGIRCKI